MISNKHKFKNWDKVCQIFYKNVHIYETFGMHPKFLDEQNLYPRLNYLKSILYNRHIPVSGRPIIAVGETGLDDTSSSNIEIQKKASIEQVLIAREMSLPLILHSRGYTLFRCMLDIIMTLLPSTHPIQWHCIKSDSDLEVIDSFISTFKNSVVSLNGATTYIYDIDRDKLFKKWIRNHSSLLDHLVLEIDCPWLCPHGLTKRI